MNIKMKIRKTVKAVTISFHLQQNYSKPLTFKGLSKMNDTCSSFSL